MQIPGYSIHEEIGRGGMSTVYRAVQESLQREVALKVLSPELSEDKEYCEQLINEGKTVAKLAHPNIVTIYDLGVHEGRYYLSMEYVAGGSLRELLDNSDLDHSEALRIFKELATILAFAHDKGVVHMDVKPRNVLVRRNGELVLTDFGISKNMMAEEELDTPSFFHASPKYMSPEQIRGKDLDKRTDMYSLGIIFYEMLVHEVPFMAKDAMGIARKHLSSPIPPLPELLTQYQQLLGRLLAKDPADRLPDMGRVIETLEWIGGKRPDDVGGDTDRLSRNELLSELDEEEEIMNIELADDGETTVAINSAFNGLDYKTAFQQEVDLDDEITAGHQDPLLATDPSLESPTLDLTSAEDELELPKSSITFPDLEEIEIDPLVAKAEDNKIWTRLFLPLGALIVGIYLLVASILPDQTERQATISPELQEIMSTAKQLESLTRSLEERLVEEERLTQELQQAREIAASAILPRDAVEPDLTDTVVDGVNTVVAGTAVTSSPVTDSVLQEMLDNEEKIQQLALEKKQLQDEIAELERVASSVVVEAPATSQTTLVGEDVLGTPETAVASTDQVLAADFDISKLPLAKTEKIPVNDSTTTSSDDAETAVKNSVATTIANREVITPVSETESTLIASVEYEPYSDDVEVTDSAKIIDQSSGVVFPVTDPVTQTQSQSTENYIDELQQEVVNNQIIQPQTEVAIVNDAIMDNLEDTITLDSSGIDLGVMLEGDMYVIDPTLEQRLKQYASKVDRLGDGRLRVILDQQDLYEPDSPELDVAARKLLDRLSYVFRNYSGFSISVIDRTAQNGSLTSRNLSWNRARSASTYLVAQGMDAPRIQHRGNNVGERNATLRGLELILEPMI